MRIFSRRFSRFASMLDFYSQFNPSPLSIKQFIDFGEHLISCSEDDQIVIYDCEKGQSACETKSFIFLRKELPVRLANIMKEIALLPEVLLTTNSVNQVSQYYARSFEEVLLFEKTDPTSQNLEKFCSLLAHIRNRHSDVVETMARGVLEMKEIQNGLIEPQMESSIQYFLDRLYMSRISIRMLINQHTLLFGEKSEHQGRHIGCLDPACEIKAVVQDAYENARFLCDQYYLASPELVIKECNQHGNIIPIRTCYVPSHLYHMLFELFKNSLRAVVEHHDHDGSDDLPPIKVLISQGKEDICVKMSDEGGGIPRSQADQLFKYMYSTAPQPSKSDMHTVPLAGYGYGLPISRLYARYFHGDIVLLSSEGFGTDAIVYLKALSDEANELLPIFNKTSSRFYKATVPTGDWSNQSSVMNHRQMNVSQPKKCIENSQD